MPGSPSTHRRARHTSLAGLSVLLVAVVAACTGASVTPSPAAPETASPVALVSQAPATSPSPEAGSASPTISPSAAAASPSASSGPGRYGGDYSTATPSPTAKPSPKLTPKPTPGPTPKPTPKPASIVVKSASTGIGKVLVGPNGMTLYTLKSDPANGSGCSGACAANWPPFTVKRGTAVTGGSGVSGTFGTFARGSRRQVMYRGRALYYFAGDGYAGDTYGQGINAVWYVAKP
jgi:predicted lipoprotein with Yx(FWY)xxD motif